MVMRAITEPAQRRPKILVSRRSGRMRSPWVIISAPWYKCNVCNASDLYLVVIIDRATRKAVAWRLANTLEVAALLLLSFKLRALLLRSGNLLPQIPHYRLQPRLFGLKASLVSPGVRLHRRAVWRDDTGVCGPSRPALQAV